MSGYLIAFEGLDQSGKQTQAEALREYVTAQGRPCELLSFPDYETSVGAEISRGLHGERDYPPSARAATRSGETGASRGRSWAISSRSSTSAPTDR